MTIPVPNWLLKDEQLIEIRNTIIEVCTELRDESPATPEDEACLEAIEQELERRGKKVDVNNLKKGDDDDAAPTPAA